MSCEHTFALVVEGLPPSHEPIFFCADEGIYLDSSGDTLQDAYVENLLANGNGGTNAQETFPRPDDTPGTSPSVSEGREEEGLGNLRDDGRLGETDMQEEMAHVEGEHDAPRQAVSAPLSDAQVSRETRAATAASNKVSKQARIEQEKVDAERFTATLPGPWSGIPCPNRSKGCEGLMEPHHTIKMNSRGNVYMYRCPPCKAKSLVDFSDCDSAFQQ